MIENEEQYKNAVTERSLLRNEIAERRAITNLKSAALRRLDKDIQQWNIRQQVDAHAKK